MYQLSSSLVVAAFNVEQMLATGVIGGGGGLLFAAEAALFKKPPPPVEDQPTPKKPNPAIAVLMIVVGLGLVVAGVIWRVKSQQPAQQ